MPSKNDLLHYALSEAKGQLRTYLSIVHDIRQKNQILIVICSLFITLPLSNKDTINWIMNTGTYATAVFLSGTILLLTSIFLLMHSMKPTPLMMIDINTLFAHKDLSEPVLKALIKKYTNTILPEIRKHGIAKRTLVRYAERFIIAGTVLIMMSLIGAILYG